MGYKTDTEKNIIIVLVIAVCLILSMPLILATPASGVWHPAEDITPGTFAVGNYVFPGKLTVEGALYMPGGAGSYLKLPTLTTTQRTALTPQDGMMIYCSTDNEIQGYWNNSWHTFTGCGPCYNAEGGTCVAKTSGWGSNLYRCIGSDKRCFNGDCVYCDPNDHIGGFYGGYLFDDGCDGCAGQGGKACWYASPGTSQNCYDVCRNYGNRGDCVPQNWNDTANCNVGKHFYGWKSCVELSSTNAPRHVDSGDYLGYRKPGLTQSCGENGFGGPRLCVCDH